MAAPPHLHLDRPDRIAGAPPELGGRLDDPAWQGAGFADSFIQMRPSPGDPAAF